MAESKTWLAGELESEHLEQIYKLLAAPFPSGAFTTTDKDVTKKGYDTTGIIVQFLINRLNEEVGIGHWQIIVLDQSVETYKTKDERTRYAATCKIVMQFGNWRNDKLRATETEDWHIGGFHVLAERPGVGGSDSSNQADGEKGALTGAIKNACKLFGCGKEVYEGEGGQVSDQDKRQAEIQTIKVICSNNQIDGALFEEWAKDFWKVDDLMTISLATLETLRENVESNPEGCKTQISAYLDKKK